MEHIDIDRIKNIGISVNEMLFQSDLTEHENESAQIKTTKANIIKCRNNLIAQAQEILVAANELPHHINSDNAGRSAKRERTQLNRKKRSFLK